jgi:predicted RNA binding protein YcfA (HicA-like mRNA interferase family)
MRPLRAPDRRESLKIREAIKILRRDGWYLDRIRGSHRQYKHADKPGVVTVAGKLRDDLSPGTLKSIWKQAGLE